MFHGWVGQKSDTPCESPNSDPFCMTERRQCLALMNELLGNRQVGWHAECLPIKRPNPPNIVNAHSSMRTKVAYLYGG